MEGCGHMLLEEGMFLDKNHELYEKLIPEDNELKLFLELTDFLFILNELRDNYCLDNGRNAISPIVLFKYILLKNIYKLSDVDVVKRTMYDLSFKYFLCMDPYETNMINPSTLTKFRRNRLKNTDLLDMLISESIKIAKKHDVIKSKTIIVDSTHTSSMYNQKSQREVLIDESKKLRKVIYSFRPEMKDQMPTKTSSGMIEDHLEYCKKLVDLIESNEILSVIPAVTEKTNMLKEIVEDNIYNLKLSKDEDAKIGHKTADTNFFGFKEHLAINEERLITAAVITSGEKCDGKQLEELVAKSIAAGQEVEEIIGDGAYSESDNLLFAKKEEIKLISKLSKSVVNGNGHRGGEFEYNKDAMMYVCPEGHLSIRKSKTNVKSGTKSYPIETYFFDIAKCKICKNKEGCYKEGSSSKSISISLKRDEFKEHKEFMESEYFKKRAKERYKIEAKNAELKSNYGLDQANGRGLLGVSVQTAAIIFASNLKRILVLKKI